MNRIIAKEKALNNGEVETRLAGKNLASIGGIKLFHKFFVHVSSQPPRTKNLVFGVHHDCLELFHLFHFEI